MAGSSSPKLTHSDSSLSLRTRKNNNDVRALAVENLSRKASHSVDERVFGEAEASHGEFQENDGLLSEVIEMGTPDFNDENWNKRKEPKKWLSAINLIKRYILYFIAIIIMIGFFGAVIKFSMMEIDKVSELSYFNGTTYFDSTVIYISLDGFRNDYLERKVTPNIDLLAKQGIRAEYMNPSFPSITFPNHWTLATGLYPEAHGIVANEFYDPILKEGFIHKEESISKQPKWWGGEPIWITSKNQGKKSAVIMWPGSNVPIKSISPDYYIPYARGTTAIDKMNIALNWLDLPMTDRPQSISIYTPQIDQKGHGGGPDGAQLNSVLIDMDNAVGHLMEGLKKRNLESHVHLVVVSDHGMAASDKSRLIFYDHILSKESLSFLREREAWPLFGIRPKDDAPKDAIDRIYNEIDQYTRQHDDPHFQFYKRENVPERFHYNSTERIAPIIMIPDVGYSIIKSTDYDPNSGLPYRPRGIHGYDNLAVEMRAIFTARGPFIEKHYTPGSVVEPFYNIEMYRFLTKLLDLSPAPNNSTLNGVFKVKN